MMISRLNGGGGLLSSGCNAARRLFVGTMHNLAQGRGGGGEDNGVFGVVQIGSSQFKVSPDDLVFVEKLSDYQVNDKVILPNVLLLSSKSRTIVGRPSVQNAEVHAIVEEHVRDAKKLTFKKKRRKGYQRLAGHRQELTGLRITHISGLEG